MVFWQINHSFRWVFLIWMYALWMGFVHIWTFTIEWMVLPVTIDWNWWFLMDSGKANKKQESWYTEKSGEDYVAIFMFIFMLHVADILILVLLFWCCCWYFVADILIFCANFQAAEVERLRFMLHEQVDPLHDNDNHDIRWSFLMNEKQNMIRSAKFLSGCLSWRYYPRPPLMFDTRTQLFAHFIYWLKLDVWLRNSIQRCLIKIKFWFGWFLFIMKAKNMNLVLSLVAFLILLFLAFASFAGVPLLGMCMTWI